MTTIVDPNTNTKLINTTGQEMEEDESKIKMTNGKTTLVVFKGLLLDLLGRKSHKISPTLQLPFPAFTLILPLFPALISHYRENDDSGLFKTLEDKVTENMQLIIHKHTFSHPV